MLENFGVNYAPYEMHVLRITVAFYSVLVSINYTPPTWRRVMTMTQMTSLHLMYTPCGKISKGLAPNCRFFVCFYVLTVFMCFLCFWMDVYRAAFLP